MNDEAIMAEVEALRERYRKKKEAFEWAQDDFEEGMILEEMAQIKAQIKSLRKILKERKEQGEREA
jgi:hypothetical protein